MPIDIHECNDCCCSSHQIVACGGCPRRADFVPAGRPLIPGQDATAGAGKSCSGLVLAVLFVLGAWGAAAGLALWWRG